MVYVSPAFRPKKSAMSIKDKNSRNRLQHLLRMASPFVESDWDTDDETERMPSSSNTSDFSQRRVIFHETFLEYAIMPLEEYTKEEKKRCWYSQDDMEKMMDAKDKAVSRLEKGKLPKRSMTYRGLESWTAQGAQELEENAVRVVNAIMVEQDRQWASQQDNWDTFARISKSLTSSSVAKALEIARYDEKEARLATKEYGGSIDSNFSHSSRRLSLSGRSSRETDSSLSPKVATRKKSVSKVLKRRNKVEGVDKRKSSIADKKASVAKGLSSSVHSTESSTKVSKRRKSITKIPKRKSKIESSDKDENSISDKESSHSSLATESTMELSPVGYDIDILPRVSNRRKSVHKMPKRKSKRDNIENKLSLDEEKSNSSLKTDTQPELFPSVSAKVSNKRKSIQKKPKRKSKAGEKNNSSKLAKETKKAGKRSKATEMLSESLNNTSPDVQELSEVVSQASGGMKEKTRKSIIGRFVEIH